MSWPFGATSAEWCYGSFSGGDIANLLTTSLFINRINVLFTLEGELLIGAWYFQSQIPGLRQILVGGI